MPSPNSLLLIGGSDPAATVGILADSRTAHRHAVPYQIIVTAINTDGICHPLPAPLIKAQLKATQVNSISGIKIGQVANHDIAHALAENLPATCPIVLDPVLQSSQGATLTSKDALDALITKLIPRAHLITPNKSEAQQLTQITITDDESLINAGNKLLSYGCHAALITGGDEEGNILTNHLFTPQGIKRIHSPRLKVYPEGLRGTGCRLATAIAIHLAQAAELTDAIKQATDYLHQELKLSKPPHEYLG